jgi:hypothetical protein
MIYALVTCAPCQAPLSSCPLNRRTYTPKVSSNRLPKAALYPLHFPLRFAPLARVILGAMGDCWFREFRKRSLDWGQGRNMVYRGYVWPTYQRRGCDGGGRRESAKSEGKHNGELRPQLRGRTSASGRRRDRGGHRRPACHLNGATRRH